MQAIDINETLNEYFDDPDRRIPNAHLESVCQYKKPGACRYISLTPAGFCCVKKTPVKNALDRGFLEGWIKATGDNCEGLGDYAKKDIKEKDKEESKDNLQG